MSKLKNQRICDIKTIPNKQLYSYVGGECKLEILEYINPNTEQKILEPYCNHPKEKVIVNSANGQAFKYCKECKTDLGNI